MVETVIFFKLHFSGLCSFPCIHQRWRQHRITTTLLRSPQVHPNRCRFRGSLHRGLVGHGRLHRRHRLRNGHPAGSDHHLPILRDFRQRASWSGRNEHAPVLARHSPKSVDQRAGCWARNSAARTEAVTVARSASLPTTTSFQSLDFEKKIISKRSCWNVCGKRLLAPCVCGMVVLSVCCLSVRRWLLFASRDARVGGRRSSACCVCVYIRHSRLFFPFTINLCLVLGQRASLVSGQNPTLSVFKPMLTLFSGVFVKCSYLVNCYLNENSNRLWRASLTFWSVDAKAPCALARLFRKAKRVKSKPRKRTTATSASSGNTEVLFVAKVSRRLKPCSSWRQAIVPLKYVSSLYLSSDFWSVRKLGLHFERNRRSSELFLLCNW